MSALSDLQSAVAALQSTAATTNTLAAQAISLLSGVSNADDPEVETAAQAVSAVASGLSTLNGQLQAALPAPAPAASTSSTATSSPAATKT